MRVRHTPRARRDLEAIYDYLDRNDPDAARAVKRAVTRAAELLADKIDVETDRSREFRGIRVGRYPYRIYYRVRGDEVWISRESDMTPSWLRSSAPANAFTA
jgi:plasmid stabilization system protein ParE